jgi:hypothetical protein
MISPSDGKMTGEAYVELADEEDIKKAMLCDRQNIDRRYIEGEWLALFLRFSKHF